jgi:hypothetical protein
MNRTAAKDIVYGGLLELMRNRNYYYKSSVGADYSHWTEEGSKVLLEYMNIMGHTMLTAEDALLNQRAKDLIVKGLKGEQV